jgi:hypothetical protein
MSNTTKYKDVFFIRQGMELELHNELVKRLEKLYPRKGSLYPEVSRTDLINSMIKHGLSLSDKSIKDLVEEYKNK